MIPLIKNLKLLKFSIHTRDSIEKKEKKRKGKCIEPERIYNAKLHFKIFSLRNVVQAENLHPM